MCACVFLRDPQTDGFPFGVPFRPTKKRYPHPHIALQGKATLTTKHGLVRNLPFVRGNLSSKRAKGALRFNVSWERNQKGKEGGLPCLWIGNVYSKRRFRGQPRVSKVGLAIPRMCVCVYVPETGGTSRHKLTDTTHTHTRCAL